MRSSLATRLAVAALATAAALAALPTSATAEPLRLAAQAQNGIELVNGKGKAVLSLRGAILGSLGSGRLVVTIFPGRNVPQVTVLGAEWERRVDERTVAYGGDDLRFRIFRGAWRVRVFGEGISASAVGRGIVGLRGGGLYSIDGAPYAQWPDEYRTFRLGLEEPGNEAGDGA